MTARTEADMNKCCEIWGKLTCPQQVAVVSGTAFIISSIMLIACAANQCYAKPIPQDIVHWCSNAGCSSYMIAIEVTSAVALVSLAFYTMYNKSSTRSYQQV